MAEFEYKNGNIFVVTGQDAKGNNLTSFLCQELVIEKEYVDIITGEVTAYLSFVAHWGDTVELSLPRASINRNLAHALMAKGFHIVDSNAKIALLVEAFLEIEEAGGFKVQKVFSQLGFHLIGGQYNFLYYRASELSNSRYYGYYDLKPQGTYQSWLKLIQAEVLGHPELELALVLGFAAPVVTGLNLSGKSIPTLIFDLYGETSSGKTTALMLAASVYGRPTKDNGGLLDDFVATKNSLIKSLSGKQGFPSFFDESTVAKNIDAELVYSISDGREKGRLSRDGQQAERASWSGAVLITGERSILDRVDKLGGLQVRLFELGDLKWTTDADHSRRIKAGLKTHYGQAIRFFLLALLDMNTDLLLGTYKKSCGILMSTFPKDVKSERIAENLAVLPLTAAILKKYMNIKVSQRSLLKTLTSICEDIVAEYDIYIEAYEFVQYCVSRDSAHYLDEGKKHEWNPDNLFGKITGGKVREVWIAKPKLEQYLEEGGFPDAQAVAKKWATKEYDLIKHSDRGRYTCRKRINKIDLTVYCIILNYGDTLPPP